MAFSNTRIMGELTIEEMALRSLLMRLYHSRMAGDVYYPKQFVNGHAPDLIAGGWIEAIGEGFRLTEAGVKGWAEMIKPLILSQRYPGINELKALVGEPLDDVRRLTKQHKWFLRTLIEAGGRLPMAAYDPDSMKLLRTHGYVIAVGEQWVEVTAAGRLVVGAEPISVTPPPPLTVNREGEKPLPRKSMNAWKRGSTYCVVPGCNEARMVSKNGKALTMCPQHQRAYWRQLKK